MSNVTPPTDPGPGSAQDWRWQRPPGPAGRKMARRSGANSGGRMFVGAIIILVGVIFLLQNLGFLLIGNIWQFWPLILIVLGISRIVNCSSGSGKYVGSVMVVIGGVFLAHNFG